MPQLLFPNEPWAIGVEVAALSYVFVPGRFFTIPYSPEFSHPIAAGLIYYLYNRYVVNK